MPSNDGSELLNLRGLFNRAKAKVKARQEGKSLRAGLPPIHPVHIPQTTMAKMLVQQGLTAAREARASARGGTRRRGRKQRSSRKRTTRKA